MKVWRSFFKLQLFLGGFFAFGVIGGIEMNCVSLGRGMLIFFICVLNILVPGVVLITTGEWGAETGK